MKPCSYCDSDGDCFDGCLCAKCIDPERYEDWKSERPEEYKKWLKTQEDEEDFEGEDDEDE